RVPSPSEAAKPKVKTNLQNGSRPGASRLSASLGPRQPSTPEEPTGPKSPNRATRLDLCADAERGADADP
ncbi:MAG: hypothetical protein ACREEM_50800, partial [Blastocatellia bacterium]